MAAYRGLARNTDFTQLHSLLEGKDLGLYIPSGITVSAGTSVNGWTDSSGNGNNSTSVGSVPTKVTLSGYPAVQFDGVDDSILLKTVATYFTGNGGAALLVGKQLGNGGAGILPASAGILYQNRGWMGDTAQFANIFSAATVAGVDYIQDEIYYTGAAFADLQDTTTTPGSVTRNTVLLDWQLDAGTKISSLRYGDRAPQNSAAVVTGFGSKAGTVMLGRTGAAVPYLNCIIGCAIILSAPLTVSGRANVRKWLGRAYGIAW